MLPESVTGLVGKAGDVIMLEVEKGAIKKFAHAIDDLNPLYLDEEYGRNSKYGSMIAPPGFFGWPTKWTGGMPVFPKIIETLNAALTEAGYPRLLDGGVDYEFFIPVRPGDSIAMLPKVARIAERDTKGGKLVFSFIETSYTNQNGGLVARTRQTLINR
ncbi:MAG: MaoC family dehydratase N-terminal domain-containing protein [Dehalococcoidales bacterium]|nr:MaoC family dehydratase N-terminal domain-containing protein [Dehalococcoidales bacterium]